MSRLLTTKNSLRMAQITNADLAAGADDEASMFFLFEQTNLKVLYKRSIDVVATLGFSTVLGTNQSILTDPAALVAFTQERFTQDIATVAGAAVVGSAESAAFIQQRVVKIILILKQFLPQFKGAAAEAITAGFSNSQALNVGFESIMDGFRGAVEAQNLMVPPITTKIKILSIVKNRPLANKLFDMLTYEFE